MLNRVNNRTILLFNFLDSKFFIFSPNCNFNLVYLLVFVLILAKGQGPVKVWSKFVRDVEERDSYEETGAVGDAVLVDACHVDPEAVFQAAAYHQAEGLAVLNAQLYLPRPRSVAGIAG